MSMSVFLVVSIFVNFSETKILKVSLKIKWTDNVITASFTSICIKQNLFYIYTCTYTDHFCVKYTTVILSCDVLTNFYMTVSVFQYKSQD